MGFEQAGFDVVAAVEIDPVHAAVHKYNFPDCAVLPRSVIGLTGDQIRSAAGIDTGVDIDVVVGGAPCQGFSLIGQRALDDPRNSLVKEYLRIVCELRPKYFVFENVKGLTVGRHRQFLAEMLDEIHAAGYMPIAPWRVLNACDYGVPQSRERLFLVGARRDLPVPTYPEKPSERPNCLDALGDLPNAEEFDTLLTRDEVVTSKWGDPSPYAAQMRCLTAEDWHYGYVRDWHRELLTNSMRTDHTEITRRRFRDTPPGSIEPVSRFFRLPKDGPSNTLRAGTDSARGAFTSPRPIHYKFGRCVTVREMARLHGFPDWFRFHETKWHGARQIGNSVPPPLARSVASEVLKALGISPSRPRAIIHRRFEWLLAMNVSEASNYWGIQNPISGRDRKSGQTKRTQIEIEVARSIWPGGDG